MKEENNYMQLPELSDKEQIEMYMTMPKHELARMLVNCNKILKDKRYEYLYSAKSPKELNLDIPDDGFLYTKGGWSLSYNTGHIFNIKYDASAILYSQEKYHDESKIDNVEVARISNFLSKIPDIEFLGNVMLMSHASEMFEKLLELENNNNLSDEDRADINCLVNKIKGLQWE